MGANTQRNKATAAAWFAAVDAASPEEMAAVAAAHLAKDVVWQGFAPVGSVTGAEAVADAYLSPLRAAFDGLERKTHILIGGVSDGRQVSGQDGAEWVGATGYLCGRQLQDVWGIPARNRPLRLRWGEFLEFDAEGRIIRIQMLIDVIDWLEQIDLSPMPHGRGARFVYPAPTGHDGVLMEAQDQAQSDALLEYARHFIFGGLNAFDEGDLKSMKMAEFFHPNLKWYGPGGIGACLSFEEFEVLHQAPWLVAFPDRKVGDLDNLIAEGNIVGASSLPGVWLTHTGTFLGYTATGRRAGINGIDFWLYENGQFTENWVFVDMIHMFAQLGIDLMARVEQMARR